MMNDRDIQRAKEQVFDAMRFLAPADVHRVFKELAESTEKLAEEYDRKLQGLICY
jgi:hypothetical protein